MSGATGFMSAPAPIKSLNAVAAVGSGTVLDNQSAKSDHTVQILTSAGVSAGDVQLQGSLDNVSWFDIGAAVAVAAANTVFQQSSTGIPARFIRASITTAITGGTVVVYIGSA